jgi:hypothetical protein
MITAAPGNDVHNFYDKLRFKAINFIQGPICICNYFHHDFLFQLLVLECLGHSSGYVWRKSEMDKMAAMSRHSFNIEPYGSMGFE